MTTKRSTSGRFRGERGAVRFGALALVTALAVTGATVGTLTGAAGSGEAPGDAEEIMARVARPAVPYFPCPNQSSSGSLHERDRVFATGRDATGAFLEIRSPEDPRVRVWVLTSHVVPDTDFDGLPEAACALDEAGPVTHPPSPTAPDQTTPPAPEPQPAEAPQPAEPVRGGTPPEGSTPSTTTTTVPEETPDEEPEDTTGPSIGTIQAERSGIWEDGAPGVCDGKPRTSLVWVEVTDDTAVASVVLRWAVNDRTGSVAMTSSGSTYQAEVGPFADDTVPFATSEPVELTVEATDAAGNTTTRSAPQGTLVLHDCTFG